jgi:Zn-dependent protease with chaperone function
MLVLCSAAASLILALPLIVAAESLHNAPAAVGRRFWLTANVLPLLCGLLLTAAGFLFLSGDIAANPHQLRVRPHICLQQLTDLPDAPFRFRLYALLALSLLLFGLVRLIWGVASSARAQRIAHRLREATEQVGEAEVFTLEAPEADCFSLGLDEPVIIVTEGLRQTLGEAEMAAVLAHEHCHVTHDDVLAQLALRALSDPLIFLPTTYYYLRAARAAMEHTCDGLAAEQTSPEALISALSKLGALKQARQLKLEGDLAPLKPTFPSYADPQARLAALAYPRDLSIALSLRAILWIETVILIVALAWLAEPLHDTLYCWSHSLLAVMRL